MRSNRFFKQNCGDIMISNEDGKYITELKKTGVIAFVPGGNSMWPTLKNRKQSVIVKLKQERLKEKDVALYLRDSGTNVLHRVIKVVEDGYIMCGDSQFITEHVKEEQVFGVMIGFYRGKRYIDVTEKAYLEEVDKLYSDEKKRKKRVNNFFFRLKIKGIPHKILSLFKRSKKEQGENDELS